MGIDRNEVKDDRGGREGASPPPPQKASRPQSGEYLRCIWSFVPAQDVAGFPKVPPIDRVWHPNSHDKIREELERHPIWSLHEAEETSEDQKATLYQPAGRRSCYRPSIWLGRACLPYFG